MKRNIEIEDTLPDRVESAIEDVKNELLEYLKEYPDETPDLNKLDKAGAIHSIVDSSVPIYTHEIDTAWYLHKYELTEAYENAGVGDNPLENNGMAAIYYYIWDKMVEWYKNNAKDIIHKEE